MPRSFPVIGAEASIQFGPIAMRAPICFSASAKRTSPWIESRPTPSTRSDPCPIAPSAKKYDAEVYVHENKWYADPDKKWAVENLLNDDDWCLILDADEELTRNLGDEIIEIINEKNNKIYKIKLKISLLWKSCVFFNQMRLFKKSAIIITDEIHNYLKTGSVNIKTSTNFIINKDNKDLNKNIFNHINKINTYSEKELLKYDTLPYYKIVLFMFIKPIFSFIHWYIINRLVIHWLSWLIVSINMAYYTFTIYSKLYEKSFAYRG